MAVVKAPALSLDASGNLGAICYSSWRGLNIARDVWTGTDPNTTKQQGMRAITKAVVQHWGGSLTEAQREAWRAVALNERRMSRVKTIYIPTGYQFFVQLNIQRKRLGRIIMDLPPASIDPYTWQAFRLGYNYYTEVVNLHFEEELNAGASEFSAEIWRAGPYNSGGRHALEGEYRFLKFIQPIGDDTDPGMTIGKWYWYWARVMDDYGRAQGWFEKQILIPTKTSGQLILNSDFNAWTADDPDDWQVIDEDVDNYITEDVPGAKIVGIIGGNIQIRQTFTVKSEQKYVIEIINSRTSGAIYVRVADGTPYYVTTQQVNVDIWTRNFTGANGQLNPEIRIWKAVDEAINIKLTSVSVYIID